jgi:hypothetical protein
MGITLCDESDIKARLQLGVSDTLTDAQQKAWPSLAEEATALVEGYLGREWDVDPDVDPPQTEGDVLVTVPRAIRVVVSRMTVRAMNAPQTAAAGLIDGQQTASSTFAGMSYNRGFGPDRVFTSPWLSKPDREALRRYVVRGQIQHVAMFDNSYNRTPFSWSQRLGRRWPWANWGP